MDPNNLWYEYLFSFLVMMEEEEEEKSSVLDASCYVIDSVLISKLPLLN